MRAALATTATLALLSSALPAHAADGADMQQLARHATAQVRHTLPPASSIVEVETPGRWKRDEFYPALLSALRAAGYGLATEATAAPAKVPLTYRVIEAWDGYVLELQFAGASTTQLYSRDGSGALVANGPLTVRGSNEQ